MEKRLQSFIGHARSKGMDHATIRMLLLSSGWKEKDVVEALSAESLSMPVPVPPDRGGAREVFLHLVTFASLYATVTNLIILFFSYIDRLYPDPALERYALSDNATSIRWSMAAVIVTFPLFLWISRVLLVEIKKHPEKAWSVVRRWLTYLTLFLAAIAIAGDVITLLFRLLEGELSYRFVFKVLILLILTGLTFVYYFISLRLSPTEDHARS